MNYLGIVCFVSLVTLSAGCGSSCPPPTIPGPMTENRAREIVPELQTGLAFSTSEDLGPCPSDMEPSKPTCSGETTEICGIRRAALEVLVIAAGQSYPAEENCSGGIDGEKLKPFAQHRALSSTLGEWVMPVEPGTYSIYLIGEDGCAHCAFSGVEGSCVVQLPPGQILVRDLID